MDDPYLGRGAVRFTAGNQVFLPLHAGIQFYIGVEDGIEGLFLAAALGGAASGRGNAKKAGRFVHHDIVFVLEKNLDAGFLHFLPSLAAHGAGDGNTLRKHRHHISLGQGMVKRGAGFAVYEDLPFGEHILDPGFGHGGEKPV